MKLLKRLDLLRGFRRLLTNWREQVLDGVVAGYTEVLQRNVSRNKLANVIVIEAAASATSGEQIPLTVWHTKFGELKTGTPKTGKMRLLKRLELLRGFRRLLTNWREQVLDGVVADYTEVLQRNVSRNKLANVIVIEAAASATSGEQIPFTVWRTKFGELKTGTPEKGGRVETQIARGLSLVDVVEQGKIEHCDPMKVYIEVGEYPLCESTPDHIWNRIDRVIMETHFVSGRQTAELGRMLRS